MRQSILGTPDYQFTDHARFFSEASYTKSETSGQIVDAFMFGGHFLGQPLSAGQRPAVVHAYTLKAGGSDKWSV